MSLLLCYTERPTTGFIHRTRSTSPWQADLADSGRSTPDGIGFAELLYSTLRTGTVLPQVTDWKQFHIERGSCALSGDPTSLQKTRRPPKRAPKRCDKTGLEVEPQCELQNTRIAVGRRCWRDLAEVGRRC